jgi:DNA-binding NtrC family response regulator
MAKILIVEDEALIRFSLADALIDAGHVVIDCGNVLEAVAALARHDDIEAVVTDIDMPGGLNGLDLAGLVTTTKPFLPVWITSGRAVDTATVDAACFLAKPYDFEALARTLTKHIAESARKARRHLSRPSERVRSVH